MTNINCKSNTLLRRTNKISIKKSANYCHYHRIFEGIVKYCATYSDSIPLSFVLGFYVTIVMQRWWSQYTSIPWPDSFAVFVSANIHGLVSKACIQHTKQINIFRALNCTRRWDNECTCRVNHTGYACVCSRTDIKVALQKTKLEREKKTTAWRPGVQLSESAFEFKRAFDFVLMEAARLHSQPLIAYRITHFRFDGY